METIVKYCLLIIATTQFIGTMCVILLSRNLLDALYDLEKQIRSSGELINSGAMSTLREIRTELQMLNVALNPRRTERIPGTRAPDPEEITNVEYSPAECGREK